MSRMEFRLPDVGEGLTEADIVSWKVKPGDTVAVNDTIVEIETAKSLVELPCPYAGVVAGLLVEEGATVEVGTPIIAVETEPAAAGPAVVEERREPAASERGSTRMAVLVGYGVKTTTASRRPRRTAVSPAPAPAAATAPPSTRPLAKPPVRKLAKALGIDLSTVTPTGRHGEVTRQDLETSVTPPPRDHAPGVGDHAPGVGDHAPQVADHAGQTRIPVKGVRRATAQAMVASAFTAPHVTEWVQVDVTRTMKLVERLRGDRTFEGVRVSPLLLVAKAVLVAARRNPGVNASWDEAAGEIVVHGAVNLGIAAATPRGLLVPNVKAADRLSLRDLAGALADLTTTAREGRTPPADLADGTLTITNVGVFGVDGGTPILNPGEAMILAAGQVRPMPWVHKGRVRVRQVMTLAVSFDHRLVDGDLGSRFLADVAAVLEHPQRALAWG